jgi:signal transduction histidine kinase
VADLPKRGGLIGSGDVERLGRAIDHLLDNATKFTPQGGTVGVRARKLPSGHLEICIADTGPGVPLEKAQRLFEPFYQVDGSPTRSYGGTGVGLAIVRGVAQGHGGDIRLASPAGEEIVGEAFNGAAFYFVVPERAGVPPSSEPPPTPSAPFYPPPSARA